MLQTNEKDNKKIEYIALYCRVDSANSQVNTLGILTQKKRLALWAEQQGFTPEQIIYLVDSGFSGRTLDRPGIQKFLSGDRKYAIMAAMDFSRFSRDLFLADELIDYADTQGTTLYVLNQDISLNQWKRERDQRLYALLKGGCGTMMANMTEMLSYHNVLSLDALTALYCRLSVDDANDGDSNSIQNQKEMLERYCKENGFTNYRFYVDDGYSGTTFDRPDFQRMVADVRAGLVKRVIIKDMSRFGRDYLQVGMYTEMIFPEYEVHFVAVNDGVDSQKGENDLTPFRNLFNEWYARDCSKKQRAVKRMKGMSGQRISSNPPYGYIKGEGGQLVPDPEAAWVVKLMFDLAAQGLGPVRIANILTKKKIPTPGTLAFRRTGKKRNYHPEAPYNWSDSTIANILEYKEYLGHTVNFKTYSKSYKFKKRLPTPEDQQMIFENTHPALVEQEVWEQVQRLREGRPRPTKQGEMALFSGLLFCADCGSPLRAHRGQNISKNQECYCCGKYRDRTNSCTMHYIRAVVLENLVLENLKQTVTFALENEQEFVRRLMNRSAKEQQKQIQSMKKELAAKERRIGELDNIIKRLYEDNISGKLSDERFKKLSTDYEKEQRDTCSEIADIQKQVNEAESKVIKIDSFLKMARKYTSFEELSRGMLHDLIEKIVIHEGDKSSGHRQQKIDIYYTFIGEVGATQLVAQLELKGKAA